MKFGAHLLFNFVLSLSLKTVSLKFLIELSVSVALSN